MQDQSVTKPVEQEAGETVAPAAPSSFTVAISRKPGKPDDNITLFTYVDGDGLGHFPCVSGDRFTKEFTDLSKARAFIDGAIECGGFVVADDSQVKAKR